MSDDFSTLLDQSLAGKSMQVGAVIPAKIVDIDDTKVTLDTGFKSESQVPLHEFLDGEGRPNVNIGETVNVMLEIVEDGYGESRLSREKAKLAEAWHEMKVAYENKANVKGRILGKVNGGFSVKFNSSVRAFLPASLVDFNVDDPDIENTELDFRIIKMDFSRQNVVLTRRLAMPEVDQQKREELFSKLKEGDVVDGKVKMFTDYGAFVSIGSIDGLLHVSNMSRKHVNHPSELLNIGQNIKVRIVKIDYERYRISLLLVGFDDENWAKTEERYPVGSIVKSTITSITEFGCFAELENGLEGLVHISEIDWSSRDHDISKKHSVGEKVDVKIIELNRELRRISLSIKRCLANPWELLKDTHSPNDKISGVINAIAEFGIFVQLESGVTGLVSGKDLSWTESSEDCMSRYKKGQEIEAVILSMDIENERLSLGVKQLTPDYIGEYIDERGKKAIVRGTVFKVERDHALLKLSENVEGYLKASEAARDSIDDLREYFRPNQEVEAKIMGIRGKPRRVYLSVKAYEYEEESQQLKDYKASQSSSESKKTSLGDLIEKAGVNTDSKEEKE